MIDGAPGRLAQAAAPCMANDGNRPGRKRR